jgi:hypothetical protein
MTRYLVLIGLALVLAPTALADGFMPAADQNGAGVLALDGKSRYVAVGVAGAPRTFLTRISTQDGSVLTSVPLLGTWGTPQITYTGTPREGLSSDGKTLVLADISNVYPRTESRFMTLDPRTLRMRDAIYLKGDFEFDAISPNGRRLYLIQHTNVLDQSRYVVRAYDVPSNTLLPRRVADPTQKGWVMEGYPVSRVISANGRWVYTLYGNPKGFPFVHALDTMRGVAHCVGVPWRGSSNAVYNLRLTLHHGSLAVHWLSGRPWLRMDTASWRLSTDHGAGFRWWTLWSLALLPLLLVLVRRRYHRLRDGGRTRTLAPRTARGHRGPARLGPWLPLTRLR